MALTLITDVRLAGVAACVPRGLVLNQDFAGLAAADRQRWIDELGVSQRRVAAPGQCASDLCLAAATALLAELSWTPQDLDLVVFVSPMGDYPLPATSAMLQDRLRAPRTCLAFDVRSGGMGYPYGLLAAGSLLASGQLRRALLLAGETAKDLPAPRDPGTAMLMGDAGTATALEWVQGAPPLYIHGGSDGARFRAAYTPAGGSRADLDAAALRCEAGPDGVERHGLHLRRDGAALRRGFAESVPASVRALLQGAALAPEQVDAFVLHQEDLGINTALVDALGLPAAKVPWSLREYGNTSCASIPLTLVTQLGARLRAERLRVVLCGFGAGLSWGAAVAELDRIACPEVTEL